MRHITLMVVLLMVVLAVTGTATANVLDPYLVKNINPQASSNPNYFHMEKPYHGRVYFSADDGVHGKELWATNGTPTGTLMLLDISPGAPGSNPQEFQESGGFLFFGATSVSQGAELWLSDGTDAGTRLVRDIRPGPDGGFAGTLTDIGDGVVVFTGFTSGEGYELWRSDGTANGTFLVRDIYPGPWPNNGMSLGNSPLVVLNGRAFFTGNDGFTGRELWVTDGTSAGTIMVKDINPGTDESFPLLYELFDGAVYFRAGTSETGFELWRSDGTEEGTVLIKDINPGVLGSVSAIMKAVNGELLFIANDGVHGSELWRSDGTEGGTQLVKDIWPGLSGSSIFPSRGPHLEIVLFGADDGVAGNELWVSDGTPAGTFLVMDINPGPGHSIPVVYRTEAGVYLVEADDGVHGRELWRSDGTPEGTVLIDDINPGPTDSNISGGFVSLNSLVLFGADNGDSGTELWAIDLGKFQVPSMNSWGIAVLGVSLFSSGVVLLRTRARRF